MFKRPFPRSSAKQARSMRAWLAGLCLLLLPGLVVPQLAYALTDLPCQEGLCVPDQDTPHTEQVLSINFGGLFKFFTNIFNYALQIYMAYQSGGADKNAAAQAAALKAAELGTNAAIRAGRMNQAQGTLALAGIQTAKDALAMSPAGKKAILKQCNLKTRQQASAAADIAYNNAVEDTKTRLADRLNKQGKGDKISTRSARDILQNDLSTKNGATSIGAAEEYTDFTTRQTALIRQAFVNGTKKLSVYDRKNKTIVQMGGDRAAAIYSGLLPQEINTLTNQADIDHALAMFEDQIEAGTFNACRNQRVLGFAPNLAPGAFRVNFCSVASAAEQFADLTPQHAQGDLNEVPRYTPNAANYRHAEAIVKAPDNAPTFGLTPPVANASATDQDKFKADVKDLLITKYGAVEVTQPNGTKIMMMNKVDISRLIADAPNDVPTTPAPESAQGPAGDPNT